jgi:glutamyl-tRNA reductase
MIDRLVVIHRNAVAPRLEIPDQGSIQWVAWHTCLRQITFGFFPPSIPVTPIDFCLPSDQVLYGKEGYEFLLQVTCGLRSPVVGETEVQGQFREVARGWMPSKKPGAEDLRRFFQMILGDAKAVREKCLKNLGSQSYGSLARKHLKGSNNIGVIGAGALAGEIVPWIAKSDVAVHVFCRNPEKFSKANHKIQVHPSGAPFGGLLDSLIVAAPLTADAIARWVLGNAHKPRIIMDLRGTSSTDPLSELRDVTVLTLEKIFEELQSQGSKIKEKTEEAARLISSLTQQRCEAFEIRPFGWEDLCG